MVDLIQRWVEEQISPWRDRAFDRDVLVAMERELELFLFSFSNGVVEFKQKPKHPGWNNHRSQLYLSLFREAYSRFCPDLDFKLLLYPGDQRDSSWGHPVFSFLKHNVANEILVPDVDFMKRNFYVSPEFTDPFQPYEKSNTAIFVGSTTGGDEITREKLESNSVPRIKSARFFKNNPRVSFKLPSVCQYDSESTREMIVAMGLGNREFHGQSNIDTCFFSQWTAMGQLARELFLHLKATVF